MIRRYFFLAGVLVLFIPSLGSLAGNNPQINQNQIETAYHAQIQQSRTLGDSPMLVLSHQPTGVLWEASLNTSLNIQVVDVTIVQSKVLVLGNFSGDMWIDDLSLTGAEADAGFLAVFDRDSGYLQRLIRMDGEGATQLLGLVADGDDWMVVGRFDGEMFMFHLSRISGDVTFKSSVDEPQTRNKGEWSAAAGAPVSSATSTGVIIIARPASHGDGGVLTNPGDTGQDPPPTDDQELPTQGETNQ